LGISALTKTKGTSMSTGLYYLLAESLDQVKTLHTKLAERDSVYAASEGVEMQKYICDLEKTVASVRKHVERSSDWGRIWPELCTNSPETA